MQIYNKVRSLKNNRIKLTRNKCYVKLSNKMFISGKIYTKDELETKLKEFFVKLFEICPTISLEQIKNNFMKLQIHNDEKISNFSFYNPHLNMMNIINDKSLFHEFLHFASNKTNDKQYNVGFQFLTEDGNYFGRGLNEGYTQFLCHKFFPLDTNLLSYFDLQPIVKKLEQIIGEEEMMDIYFNGSINDIKEKLANFSNEENVTNFINELDNIFDLNYQEFNGILAKEDELLVRSKCEVLMKYLDECLLKKSNKNVL